MYICFHTGFTGCGGDVGVRRKQNCKNSALAWLALNTDAPFVPVYNAKNGAQAQAAPDKFRTEKWIEYFRKGFLIYADAGVDTSIAA